MKNAPMLVPAILAILAALPFSAEAQQRDKGGQSKTDQAVDTAGKILDALLGDKSKRGQGAPRADERTLAEKSTAFAGAYRAANGSQATIRPAGAGCFVQMTDAKNSFDGVGFAFDGYFAASFDPGRQGGVVVYRIDGGKLAGTGVRYAGDGIGVLSENLEGSKKLSGDYKITSAADVDGTGYTGSCTIKQVAENSLQLTWNVAGGKFYGVGFVMGPNLWVAWSPKKDAFLVVFERSQDDPSNLARHLLSNTGKPPQDLAPVKAAGGGFPAGVAAVQPVDQNRPGVVVPGRQVMPGNVVPPGRGPARLEQPIDLPPNAAGRPVVGVPGGPIDLAPQVGVPAGGAAAPVIAPGQTAADLADKKSQDQGAGEATLTVTNATGGPIRVNWIDQDGKEGTSEDTIPAGRRVEMGTAGVGHFFRARDARTNALLQEFRIKNTGGRFDITITGRAAGGVAAAPGQPLRSPVAVAPARVAPVAVLPAAGIAGPADQKGIAEFLKVHNDARAEVGVEPIQWDPDLAAYAQQWANNLAARNAFEHRPDGKYGENIAGYTSGQGEGPASGARMWYGEKKNYRPGSRFGDPQKGEVGHYTQMVWRKSTRVGFGVATNSKGMSILVANYDPPGNFPEEPY